MSKTPSLDIRDDNAVTRTSNGSNGISKHSRRKRMRAEVVKKPWLPKLLRRRYARDQKFKEVDSDTLANRNVTPSYALPSAV